MLEFFVGFARVTTLQPKLRSAACRGSMANLRASVNLASTRTNPFLISETLECFLKWPLHLRVLSSFAHWPDHKPSSWQVLCRSKLTGCQATRIDRLSIYRQTLTTWIARAI
jgi:hypothetical protein